MTFKHEIQATVIADSITPQGVRLTTMEVTFHRFILAEVNTHRVFSRNSASSRAIPLETMLKRAMERPAYPVSWPKEQKGMSGGDELTGDDLQDAADLLRRIRHNTTDLLTEYISKHPDKSTRLHKSLLNRPLEWFMWHTAILSSTEWDNLFRQRIDPDAQPEFHELAKAMKTALDKSQPKELWFGEWHLPYSDYSKILSLLDRIKVSTARCARVSYLTHDGIRDYAEDIRMHDETLWAKGHWSPMEHPAMCVPVNVWDDCIRNFDDGWLQYRYFAEDCDHETGAEEYMIKISERYQAMQRNPFVAKDIL